MIGDELSAWIGDDKKSPGELMSCLVPLDTLVTGNLVDGEVNMVVVDCLDLGLDFPDCSTGGMVVSHRVSVQVDMM